MLSIADLHVTVHDGAATALRGVSLAVHAGEIVGLVGESGSGKTLTCRAALGVLPPGVAAARGTITFGGEDVTALPPRRWERLHGSHIGAVFQDPASYLNPNLTVGSQVTEVLRVKRGLSRGQAHAKAIDLLTAVGLHQAGRVFHQIPAELSGGMLQRVMIAIAISCDPELLIADEATTALDVTIQAEIIELIKDLRDQRGLAVLFVSHDLAVIRELCDRVVVFYAGEVVEAGPVKEIIGQPRHPYTQALLRVASAGDFERRELQVIAGHPPPVGAAITGCRFAGRCPAAVDACRVGDIALTRTGPAHEARCARLNDPALGFPDPAGARRRPGTGQQMMTEPMTTEVTEMTAAAVTRARPLLEVSDVDVVLGRGWRASHVLNGVTMSVRPGEIVGLVGETGSGKTTLARTVVGLARPRSGRVAFNGRDISRLRGAARRKDRRAGHIQLVFQDPLRSLDPDLTVGDIVGEGLRIRRLPAAEVDARVTDALEKVGLTAALRHRQPGQISGGQRQRVSIARALAVDPQLLLCDEPVSALDASNRNYVLRLLAGLRDRLGLPIVIISHDLSSLAGIADRVVVLYRGRVVEDGPVEQVFTRPRHPYTALLMASAPRVVRPGGAGDRELSVRQLRRAAADPEPPSAPGACVFAARCPFAVAVCAVQPALEATPPDQWSAACHRQREWPDLARDRASKPRTSPRALPGRNTSCPSSSSA